MKNQLKSQKMVNRDNQLTLDSFKNNELLNLSDMSSIRGGDGEANGGGDIIMIPKCLKQ
jgi:hypothetical protein